MMKAKAGAKTNRTEITAIRMRKDTREALEIAAYDSHRTVSNWIECAILWALKEKAVPSVPRPEVNDD
jgi:hypothetical protein